MAKGIDFDEANFTWGGGSPDVDDLCAHVFRQDGIPVTISKWQLTKEELFEVINTGCVWLRVWGSKHPPVFVGGHHPFAEPSKAKDDAAEDQP